MAHMNSVLGRRAFGTAVQPCPAVALRQPRAVRMVVRAGIFDFLQPKTKAPPVPQRAAELVDELVALAKPTDAGAKASPELKERISTLVEELEQYAAPNPIRSPLLWGEYEVLYSSKPTAVGGPLRSGAGPVLFPGQRARQVLEPPNLLTNVVNFNTLGFLPGYTKQFGEIKALSSDTFLLTIETGEIKAAPGPAITKEFNIQRKIQISYLDPTLRIARFLPDEDLVDNEGDSNEPSEPILFVFRRVEPQAKEEEEEEEEEEPEAPKALSLFSGSRRPAPPTATMYERAISKEEARANKLKEAEAARARKAEEVAARAAAAEAAKKAKIQEAEERAEQLQAARESAEKEKEAQRERQAAIREQLAELSEELKEAQAEAREATREVATLKKDNAPALKLVAKAKAEIDDAESAIKAVASELEAVARDRQALEQRTKELAAALKQTEASLRQKVAAVRQ